MNFSLRFASIVSVGLLLCRTCFGGEISVPLDSDQFSQWSGLHAKQGAAQIDGSGEAIWTHPDGARGLYKHGFRELNDGAGDWSRYKAIQFEIHLEGNSQPKAQVEVSVVPFEANDGEKRAKVAVLGKGWHSITLPWTAFDIPSANRAWLLQVKRMKIAARYVSASHARFAIRNVRLISGVTVSLDAPLKGMAVKPGKAAEYPVTVGNCTGSEQSITLSFARCGWEAMEAKVEPAQLTLAPGKTANVIVRVEVPERLPGGGHETQVLQAIANGDAAAAEKLSFVTSSELAHPHILHTPARWQAVREKVEKYDWARKALAEITEQAEKWQVPAVAKPPENDPDDTMGPFLFATNNETNLMACGISWQVTGNKEHARKVAEFLKRLSDPVNGYPKTLRGCNQSLVQEGHFFQHNAMAYDMILDAGVLSAEDRKQIEQTFRIFIETIDRECRKGMINNWNLSEAVGALYCSLAMEDLSWADRFFSGPGGVMDQLSKGTMDDGWWYECSISYNVWCASEFSQVALALEPWGINFRDLKVPASYSQDISLSTVLSGGGKIAYGPDQAPNRPFGMAAEVWGPMRRPYRQITDLWNSLLPFIDYRGVMFGVNDSIENQVGGVRREIGGQPFELAYYLFRDPSYAAVLSRSGQGVRDLLYGVPELPEKLPEQFRDSAKADNVGLAMLRSQTPSRPIREQIQAVLHYGTHGWAHGHYDRTNLLSLMRYGRSCYNPESVWYSYEPFMYKFFCQTSLSANMVVVDRKNQEATPGECVLFKSGSMMQAAAVQTTARWSNPPYGGMVYNYVPVKSFAEKTWREGREVPIPKNPPVYGTLTDYSEPVLQRRLMLVTDDYVVLADYEKGSQPHCFESLFQLKGFLELEGHDKSFLRHDSQWDPDPVKAAQFVTDADWYSLSAPSTARFLTRFGPSADNEGNRTLCNDDGVLRVDVHSLWPSKQEIMLATAPENHEVQKRLFYSVSGDGKILVEGKIGTWILGSREIDVPVESVKELVLQTKTELAKKPTLFWAGARIVTKEGKEIPLSHLPMRIQNVKTTKEPNRDYFGGPVKILGTVYKEAVAAEPKDSTNPGRIHVDLSGVGAVRFKSVIGGDYPLGDESQRRKTVAVRAPGNAQEGLFLTVIEPYEEQPMVNSAKASDPEHITVELADGRTQEITIANFKGTGRDIQVRILEKKNNAPTREEKLANTNQ